MNEMEYRDHTDVHGQRLDARMEMWRRGVEGANLTVMPPHDQGVVDDVDYHQARAIMDVASNGSYSPYEDDNPSYRTVTVNTYATDGDNALEPTDDPQRAEYMTVTVQAVIDLTRLGAAKPLVDSTKGVLEDPVNDLLEKQAQQCQRRDQQSEDTRTDQQKRLDRITRDIGAVAT